MSAPVHVASDTIVPPRLRAGDIVAVCAPAGPVDDPGRLDAGLAVLASRYRVAVDREGVLARSGFLAGSDERRADELNRALADPDVRAIVIVRGGYGLTRILDRLDHAALRADPKPIVGFSDTTALLFWAASAAGVRGIHGPMVTQLGELPGRDRQALFDILESTEPIGSLPITPLAGASAGAADEELAAGPLVGGNLCLLSHLAGTPYLGSLAGAVVLVEDVGERPYAIDRYLTHLGQAAGLRAAAAVVAGDFHGCSEPKIDGSPDALAVVAERASSLHLPAVHLAGVGHGSGNRAVPFGARAAVSASHLRITEAAVA